jgi:hypothetical protein
MHELLHGKHCLRRVVADVIEIPVRSSPERINRQEVADFILNLLYQLCVLADGNCLRGSLPSLVTPVSVRPLLRPLLWSRLRLLLRSLLRSLLRLGRWLGGRLGRWLGRWLDRRLAG